MRDLSTVEELELMLAMSRYALHLFDASEQLTKDQIAPRILHRPIAENVFPSLPCGSNTWAEPEVHLQELICFFLGSA